MQRMQCERRPPLADSSDEEGILYQVLFEVIVRRRQLGSNIVSTKSAGNIVPTKVQEHILGIEGR